MQIGVLNKKIRDLQNDIDNIISKNQFFEDYKQNEKSNDDCDRPTVNSDDESIKSYFTQQHQINDINENLQQINREFSQLGMDCFQNIQL